jgi:hypothetical protein
LTLSPTAPMLTPTSPGRSPLSRGSSRGSSIGLPSDTL